MPNKYQLPQATILRTETARDLSVVQIKLSSEAYLSYPIAPGDLRISDPFQTIWEFHQLIARDGPILTFETYETNFSMPLINHVYDFCSWWLGTTMDAVRDMGAVWNRMPYPDNGSHDFCPITYENISAQGPLTEAYKSNHGWISVEAYEKYILQDALRVRNASRSIEWAA